ncbi:HNH endonuclease signature motif containing protein [Ponticaulis sp.]|uniref:HNH endonuclease n=1 Tax=Ponticaulis sp. TaxID=2020902 RepID=UPI000B64B025|nr:HNH endonuclease signature motif containing protein [Ponticaulis sp.]MAI89945.1 HNH endonuclease [Ponticaulis sp.]OUY00264.1 MAG: HNH endonuclease [Hyphomonadaceae bacterium TMED5]
MSQPFKPAESEAFKTLWVAQNGLCALCGEPMPKHRFEMAHRTLWQKKRPTFDHIIPRSKQGVDDVSNLQLTHADCNKRKGSSVLGDKRSRTRKFPK